MPGPINFGTMAQGLLGAVTPVAQKFPQSKMGILGDLGSEGARVRAGGGTGIMPMSEFTNGNIRPTQTYVDPKGVAKYRKAISSGERPVVTISPSANTIHGRNNPNGYHISDGHTRLRAYYDLGITEVPVVIK